MKNITDLGGKRMDYITPLLEVVKCLDAVHSSGNILQIDGFSTLFRLESRVNANPFGIIAAGTGSNRIVGWAL
ncbi:MAG: hypothetical protein ACLPN1_12550 [Dissulfurispiraceae bacterium]